MSQFVHLRARSTFSLLEGAIHIKSLIALAAKSNMPALALTDHDNLFASLEFSKAAADEGVQPIIGCTLSFAPLSPQDNRHASNTEPEQLLLIAKDKDGYHNLLKLCSKSYTAPAGGHAPLLNYADLEGTSSGLIALTGGQFGAVGKRLFHGHRQAAVEELARLAALFPGRLYVELMRHGLEEERRIEKGLIELAMEQNIPLVATNDIHFTTPDMYEAHDALLCIADGRYVSEGERRRLTPEHYFKTPGEMAILFADIPEAIENTMVIAKRCAAMSPARAPILPSFAEDEAESLREQARKGLEERLVNHVFGNVTESSERERLA